jgi:uncharacterized protein
MEACHPYQTSDTNSSGFCKRKKKSYSPCLPIVIASVVIGASLVWMPREDVKAQTQAPPQPRVSDKTDYWARAIRMTDISAKVENGIISIPIDVVKEKKIVRFSYESNGAKLPLLSYVTQAGKVVTAVSVCEPCRSTRFHIKDKLIVCNSCYTEWNLETLAGIKGGCLKYPPDAIPNRVDKGQILIDEKIVAQWRPRLNGNKNIPLR